MSEETFALAHQVMDALSNRDLVRLLALADPDIEWHSFFAQLGKGGVYRGFDGTREYMRDLSEAWEVVRADIDDGIAVGEVAVLVGRIHYRGKGSGIETENGAGWLLTRLAMSAAWSFNRVGTYKAPSGRPVRWAPRRRSSP
jgi:ketosteroid isomerase-like protein